jgi:transposase
MRFRGILHGRDPDKFESWLDDAHRSGLYGLRRFAYTIRNDLAAVRNAITERWSNGQTEGQINRLKTLKRQMYGHAGTELLRARLLHSFRLFTVSSPQIEEDPFKYSATTSRARAA